MYIHPINQNNIVVRPNFPDLSDQLEELVDINAKQSVNTSRMGLLGSA